MNKLVNKIRTEVALLSFNLHNGEKKMNDTTAKDRKQNRRLDNLLLDVTQVNKTVYLLKSQIEAIAVVGFNESYSSILKSYLESTAAERIANGSVSGPGSPVFQSRQTRLETEKHLKDKLDAYRKNMTAQKSSLKELQKKVQDLNVNHINVKICGAPGDQPCDQAPCGGANCRDDEGQRKCGGEGCNGAVPISTKALKNAQNATIALENMANQLNDISQKIQEVQGIAQEAKAQSELTLNKAEDAKRRMEDSTDKLRQFIKKIKDFLTAGSMIHVWWTCPALQPYWSALTNLIQASTGIRIPQTPDCLLLHNYPPKLPKTTKYLIYQINIAALTLISRSWKKAEAPTMPQCIQIINTTKLYELASRTAFSTRATFWKTAWQTWEIYEAKPPPHHST
ncbi:Hypothetical predicted protein [Pelobates cultripes]|uniref:Uncharacterized protein n=2 Tax=Pelobates cultripes TaxID=61616 RepID=A0AAD1WH47_PELCU|nr:Hypothetical predicted protein [Pelobates cultripes]